MLLWVVTGDAYNGGEYGPLGVRSASRMRGMRMVGERLMRGYPRVGQWCGVKDYYEGASHFNSAVGISRWEIYSLIKD